MSSSQVNPRHFLLFGSNVGNLQRMFLRLLGHVSEQTDAAQQTTDQNCGSPPDTRTDSNDASVSNSTAPSPVAPKGRASGIAVPGTNLRYFNKPIPEKAQRRFFDLKVLYTRPLLDSVAKKEKSSQGDISMKLRYLGTSEEAAKLYILIQCEAKVAKTVRKFFEQKHVSEELEPDFSVLVLGEELLRLASTVPIQVFSETWPTDELCGMPIRLEAYDGSAFAALGGLILVEARDTRLYGLMAAHAIQRLSASPTKTSRGTPDQVFNGKEAVGTIMCHTSTVSPLAMNHDWAILDLDLPRVVPSSTIVFPKRRALTRDFQHIKDNRGWKEAKPVVLCHPKDRLAFSSQRVHIQTPHGLQTGILMFNKSVVRLAPGIVPVEVFDLVIDSGSSLTHGDSGSWVVDQNTGEVFGHVTSIDALGEAQVMPMRAILNSIKERLDATRVSLPTLQELDSLKRNSTDSARRDYWIIMTAVGLLWTPVFLHSLFPRPGKGFSIIQTDDTRGSFALGLALHSGLSTAALVGIMNGMIGLVFAMLLLGVFLWQYSQQKKASSRGRI